MIRAQMEYGALSSKVHALYGKRLRLADFEHMASLRTEAELSEYLRSHPAWSACAARLAGGVYIGRVELELALWDQFRTDYRKLLHFIPRADKALFSFPILLQEQRAILSTLRRLKAGHPLSPLPRSILHSTLDLQALASCTDFDGLTAAARDTIYAPALHRLRPAQAGTLPDYTGAETLLRSTYFSHMYHIIHKCYRGETKAVLLRAYGEQIDWFNLIHILRLKTYFPGQSDYLPVLFPFNYRLRPEMIRALCAAPDLSSARELLQDTPYAAGLSSGGVEELEDAFRRAFYTFNRRQLTHGTPSIYTAMAYLNLKDLELHALVSLIESVKYGVPYDTSLARLFG